MRWVFGLLAYFTIGAVAAILMWRRRPVVAPEDEIEFHPVYGLAWAIFWLPFVVLLIFEILRDAAGRLARVKLDAAPSRSANMAEPPT
jgi:hypothetical protein